MPSIYAKDGSYRVTVVNPSEPPSGPSEVTSPTLLAALNNILSELETQSVLLQTIADNTTPPEEG